MAITRVRGNGASASSTTVSVNAGGTPSVGNLLVAITAKRNGTAAQTVSLNNGTWTQVDRRYTGSTAGEWPIVMFYQFVTGSLSATTQATWSGSGDNMTIAVIEFSGVGSFDTGKNVGASAFTTAATISITPTSGVDLVLLSGVIGRTDTTPVGWTPGGSMNEEFESAGRPPVAFNYQIVTSSTGSYTVGSTGGAAILKAVIGASFLASTPQTATVALIDQTAVAYAPAVGVPPIVLGLINQTAATFTPTVSPQQFVTLGLITQSAACFSPTVGVAVFDISLDLTNQAAVTFAPTVTTTASVVLGLINRTAVIHAPAVSYAQAISLALIDRTATPHAPSISQPGTREEFDRTVAANGTSWGTGPLGAWWNGQSLADYSTDGTNGYIAPHSFAGTQDIAEVSPFQGDDIQITWRYKWPADVSAHDSYIDFGLYEPPDYDSGIGVDFSWNFTGGTLTVQGYWYDQANSDLDQQNPDTDPSDRWMTVVYGVVRSTGEYRYKWWFDGDTEPGFTTLDASLVDWDLLTDHPGIYTYVTTPSGDVGTFEYVDMSFVEGVISLGRINQTATAFAPSISRRISLGLINRTAVAHAPEYVGPPIFNLTFARINRTAVLFNPTITTGVATISLDLIVRNAIAFAPTVLQGVITLPLLDRTAVAHAPTVAWTQTVAPGFIDRTAVPYAPTLAYTQAITVALIDQTAVPFEPVVKNKVIQLPIIFRQALTFQPESVAATNSISLALLTQGRTLFSPTVATSANRVLTMPRIDQQALTKPITITNISGLTGEFRPSAATALTITDPPVGQTFIDGDFSSFDPTGTRTTTRAPRVLGESSANNFNGGTTIGFGNPAEGASDGYLVLWITYDGGGAARTITAPTTTPLAPWGSLPGYDLSNGDAGIAAFSKYVRSDDPANFTFTLSVANQMSGVLVWVDQVTNLTHDGGGNTASTTSHNVGTFTNFNATDELILLVNGGSVATTFSGQPSPTFGVPAGMNYVDGSNSVAWSTTFVWQAELAPSATLDPGQISSGIVYSFQNSATMYRWLGIQGNPYYDVAYAGWIKLELTETMAFTFDTSPSTMTDTVLEILSDPDGLALYFNDDTRQDGGQLWSSIGANGETIVLDPGLYYIRVWPFDGPTWDLTGDATLIINRVPVNLAWQIVDDIDDVDTITDPPVGETYASADFAGFSADPRDPEEVTFFTDDATSGYSGWFKLVLNTDMYLAMDTYGSLMYDTVLIVYKQTDPPDFTSLNWDASDDGSAGDRDFRHSALEGPGYPDALTYLWPAGTYWVLLLPYFGESWPDNFEPDLDPPEGTEAHVRITRTAIQDVIEPRGDPPVLPPYRPGTGGSGAGDGASDVYSTIVIRYDGVDITDFVKLSNAQFTYQVSGNPGTANIEVKDVDHSFSFAVGKELTLDIDDRRMWGGYVTNCAKVYPLSVLDTTDETTVPRLWRLSGVDYNILFQKRIIYDPDDPDGHITFSYAVGMYDDTIINDLFDNYLDLADDGLSRAGVERVDVVTVDVPGVTTGKGSANHGRSSVASAGFTWKSAMDTIARATGAIYYISPDKVFYYVDVDTESSDHHISDQPRSDTDVGLQGYTLQYDGTKLVNDMFVWGAANKPIKFSRVSDSTSIGEHGRWQQALFSTSMYKQLTVDLVAESYVYGTPQSQRGGKDDRISIQARVFRPEFSIGEKVSTSLNIFGYRDVIPIRRMQITFVNPHQAIYDIVLSHEIDPPWSMFEIPPFPGFGFPHIPQLVIPEVPIVCEGGLAGGLVLDNFNRTQPQVYSHSTTVGNLYPDWGFGDRVNWTAFLFNVNNHYYVNGDAGVIVAAYAHYIKVSENDFKAQFTDVGSIDAFTGDFISLKTLTFKVRFAQTEKIVNGSLTSATTSNRPNWVNPSNIFDLDSVYNSLTPTPNLTSAGTLPAGVSIGSNWAQLDFVPDPSNGAPITGTIIKGDVDDSQLVQNGGVWYGSDGGGFVRYQDRYANGAMWRPGTATQWRVDHAPPPGTLYTPHPGQSIEAIFYTAIDDRAGDAWTNKFQGFVDAGGTLDRITIDRSSGSGAAFITVKAANAGTSQATSPMTKLIDPGIAYYFQWYRPARNQAYLKVWGEGEAMPTDWQASEITNGFGGTTSGPTGNSEPSRRVRFGASIYPMQSYEFQVLNLVAGDGVYPCDELSGGGSGGSESTPDPLWDGITWHLPFRFRKGSSQVWVNSLRLRNDQEYTEQPNEGTLTFTPPVDPLDEVYVIYSAVGPIVT